MSVFGKQSLFGTRTNPAGLALKQWLLILLIFAGLVVIGIPLAARAKKDTIREQVSQDLMRLVAAREQYALEQNLKAGEAVTIEQLIKDGRFLKEIPEFLVGREVELGPVGGRVKCKLDSEWFDPLPTKEKPAPTVESQD